MVRLDLPRIKGVLLQSASSQASKANNFFYLGTNQRISGVLHEIIHQPFLADSAERVWEI